MIVRNEEHNLPACLATCADLVDEIIIVDTGSTDRTKEVAAGFGARVFDFPWVDDFAAARNKSLRHATGKWIFWMDADDRIDDDNRARLRDLFAKLGDEKAAYILTCSVLPSGTANPIRVVDHTRLFRRLSKVRWHYRVHEQVLPSLRESGAAIHRRSDIVIRHIGYQDAELSKAKQERNLRLMQMDHEDNPNDSFTLYNLGRAHDRMGKPADALSCWRRSLVNAPPEETYVPKLYYLMGHVHFQLGQQHEALLFCLAGLARFPNDTELLVLSSSVLAEAGDPRAAEACLLRLFESPRQGIALGDDPGLRGFKARCQLAKIYRNQKRNREAERQWREGLKEEPNYPQIWLGLGQLFIDEQRWEEFDETLSRLDANPDGKVEAAVLRGLRLANDKEFAAARKLADETIAEHPDAIEPRILKCRLLWRERNDNPEAAAQAYRDVLAIDPANGEAKCHLEKLKAAT